jgi:restriction system protein
LFLCHACGWWQVRQDSVSYAPGARLGDTPEYFARYACHYHSVLEDVDISSNDVAVADLRRHLRLRWNDRTLISAGKAEELVAAVLRDHLQCDVYHATAHVNTPDDGIDLFVASRDGNIKAAVQVKRRITAEVEPVEPIRSFVGALVIEGYDRGIFVTTALQFSPAALQVPNARPVKNRRLELELIDGERLLELLRATSPPQQVRLPDIIMSRAE